MTPAPPEKTIRTPRSAYIHVPFCRHRCGYCNFTLVAGRDDLVEPYLSALERELSWLSTPREVDTLFFGGGTPTQLHGRSSAPALRDIVFAWHPLTAGCELSVEANPADISDETASILAQYWRHARQPRRSVVQRCQVRAARARSRRRPTSRRAVQALNKYSFDLSLDLIFAAPGETLDDWRDDLAAAMALAPDHVSTYGLTFESGTTFWNRRSHGELQQADEVLERGDV